MDNGCEGVFHFAHNSPCVLELQADYETVTRVNISAAISAISLYQLLPFLKQQRKRRALKLMMRVTLSHTESC